MPRSPGALIEARTRAAPAADAARIGISPQPIAALSLHPLTPKHRSTTVTCDFELTRHEPVNLTVAIWSRRRGMVGERAGNFCAIAAANCATISPASLLFTSAVQSVPHLPQVLAAESMPCGAQAFRRLIFIVILFTNSCVLASTPKG